jgi:hypothetical protein
VHFYRIKYRFVVCFPGRIVEFSERMGPVQKNYYDVSGKFFTKERGNWLFAGRFSAVRIREKV